MFPCTYLHFKTSYVEVYRKGEHNSIVGYTFQNILCWSLSEAAHQRNITFPYFKTSYVEVYPRNSRQGVFPTRISKHLMLKFIKMWLLMNGCLPNFKTSYVEVYRNWIWLKVEIKKNFKTSYVEVYRWTHGWCSTGNEISKHLMLKFITKEQLSDSQITLFQNILCWSLSLCLSPISFHHYNFKTSYVEVYLSTTDYTGAVTWFQNILCWSLSLQWML